MKYIRLSFIVLGLSALSACVNSAPTTNIDAPPSASPDGSPVVGQSRGY